MFAKITNLFASSKKTARKPALNSFRPALETLDAREMPSVASGALHAVSPTPGVTRDLDYFYLDNNTHLLKEGSLTLNGGSGTPSGIQTLSAGHDANGRADVFVKAGDNSFWEFQAGKWTRLRGSNVVKTYAAVDGGRAYAIMSDNTLDEYDGHNWIRVNGSGLFTNLDAVTDKSGRDNVFALGTDNTLWQYAQFNPGSAFLADRLTNGFHAISQVTNFSAGTDILGNAEVYANFHSHFGGDSLYKNNHGSMNGWLFALAGSNYKSFSATDSGAVWIAAPSGAVFELDQFAHLQNFLGSSVAASSISAASSTDVYIVSSNHSINEWLFDPIIGAWATNNGIGSSQQ